MAAILNRFFYFQKRLVGGDMRGISKMFSEKHSCVIHMWIRMTAETIFVGEIRAYFNTGRTLEATEVSHVPCHIIIHGNSS